MRLRPGRLGQRVPPPLLVVGGMALIAASMLVLAGALDPSSSPGSIAPELSGIGIGFGIVIPNLTEVIMDSVGPADIGRASGTLSAARQVGAVCGVAVAVAVAVFGLTGSSATAATETAGVRGALIIAGLAALTATALALLATTHRRESVSELAPSRV